MVSSKSPLPENGKGLLGCFDYLLAQMTLDEKFCFLAPQTPAIERLGIEPFAIGGEAAHGVEARLLGLQDKISDIYISDSIVILSPSSGISKLPE